MPALLRVFCGRCDRAGNSVTADTGRDPAGPHLVRHCVGVLGIGLSALCSSARAQDAMPALCLRATGEPSDRRVRCTDIESYASYASSVGEAEQRRRGSCCLMRALRCGYRF